MRAVLHRHQPQSHLQSHLAHLQRRRVVARGERGQSLLEFALIVPVLFLMLIGVAFIAQGFNLQMVLYGAAYEGARIWAKNPVGGDFLHCSPPACNPDEYTARNFEKYVIPSVRQYITTNGFDGEKVFFFAEDRDKFETAVFLESNNPQTVKVLLMYPMELPIGNFAGGYQRLLVVAGCTLKRGA